MRCVGVGFGAGEVLLYTGVLQRKAASQNQEVQSSVASVGEALGGQGT